MKLAEMTWKQVDALDREMVVLIPTGSLEQHGAHLPLFTDSLLATAAAEAVDGRIPTKVLLTPTLWLGASGHHLGFSGTLSADFDTYMGAILSVVESLLGHGFRKFFVVNGHGGNTEPNGMALRRLKARFPHATFGHSGYFAYVAPETFESMRGPIKGIQHACEAETSLMLHLHPHLVRTDVLRDDGLSAEPPIRGLVHHFDEVSEEGSIGYATFADAETGRLLFESAVGNIVREMESLYAGYVLRSNRTEEPVG